MKTLTSVADGGPCHSLFGAKGTLALIWTIDGPRPKMRTPRCWHGTAT